MEIEERACVGCVLGLEFDTGYRLGIGKCVIIFCFGRQNSLAHVFCTFFSKKT